MDIIFFAAIAFYIFFKLKSQLGKIDEDEKKIIQDKINQRNKVIEELQKKISTQVAAAENITLVGQKTTAENEKAKIAEANLIQNLDSKSKEVFTKAIASCNITAEFFVSGARSAFEMVIKAFSAGDLETLKFLLSDKIYQSFEQAISQRKASGQVLVTNIIAIEKTEVISALMIENEVSIAVKIVSKQINYLSNQSQEIVEGSKNEINELTDIWTFKKDITSKDPNWIIISTHL